MEIGNNKEKNLEEKRRRINMAKDIVKTMEGRPYEEGEISLEELKKKELTQEERRELARRIVDSMDR